MANTRNREDKQIIIKPSLRFIKTWVCHIFDVMVHKLLALYLVGGIFSSMAGFAQTPDFRCISVNGSSVELTWINNDDSVNIYRNQTGSYILIDSVLNPAVNTYTDLTANINNIPSYFIQSRTNTLLNSDTLKIIDLNVSNALPGIASISWNQTHSPLLPTSSTWYNLFREYPIGVWNNIDSTQLINYNDSIDMCFDTSIFFRVEIKDASGCLSVSTIDGAKFYDITAPAIPVIDSVSVDENGNVIIGWQISQSKDAEGYIIYKHLGGNFSDSIAAINGINNTQYIYDKSNSGTTSDTYQIAAFDSCGNISSISTPMHNTILLEYTLDRCEKNVNLRWNAYKGWQVSKYDVFFGKNNNPKIVIGTLMSADSLIFSQSNINDGDSLCFFIRAHNNDDTKTSSSNRLCFVADIINKPDSTYLRVATVQSTSQVYLQWLVDLSADIMKYKILRGTSLFGIYDTIATIPASYVSMMNYTDRTALPSEKSYYYRLLVIDSCGINSFTSNVGRTIFLTATPKMDSIINELEWNKYEGWLGEVSSYNIYRSIDDGATTLLVSLPFTYNSYVDDVNKYIDTDGKFCYYIEAVENGIANSYNLEDTSYSNVVCAIQMPHLYIPNAFIPTSQYNPIFKPINIFADINNYVFQIFDRWGHLLFETSNPEVGWDGVYKGKPAQFGVYVYYVRFTGTNGRVVGESGTVTLLR